MAGVGAYHNGGDVSTAGTSLRWAGSSDMGPTYPSAQRNPSYAVPPTSRHNNLVMVPTMEVSRNTGIFSSVSSNCII